MVRGENEWESLYGNVGRQDNGCMMQMPVDSLVPWKSSSGETQPFAYYSPEDMEKLRNSIRANGILTPIQVRPSDNGKYQVVDGHHRLQVALEQGLQKVPAIIKDIDDFDALVMMSHSNTIHRSKIPPSELIRCHAQLMAAIPNRRGQRTDLTGDPNAGKASVQVIADELGESYATIYRYFHISRLPDFFMPLIDADAICLAAADTLSSISREGLSLLQEVMEKEKIRKITPKQADALADADADIGAYYKILSHPAKDRNVPVIKVQCECSGVPAATVKKLQKDPNFQCGLNEAVAEFTKNYLQRNPQFQKGRK